MARGSGRIIRRHLTLQQKVAIIDKREREGLKQDELARWAATEFNLPKIPTQPTISIILKDKERLREALRLNPQRNIKSVRDVTCPQFEETVVQWILASRPMERRAVMEYASTIKSQFPLAEELALSEGWLSRMLERRGISLRGDGGDVEDDHAQETSEADETMEDDTPPVPNETVGERRETATPSTRPVARQILPSPQPTRTNARLDDSVSPRWSDIASPVFTNSPMPIRATRHRPPSASNHQAPVSLRSLARAASPQATQTTPQHMDLTKIYQHVCEYYGSLVETMQDLRTLRGGQDQPPIPKLIHAILRAIPDAITERSFDCGLPIPLGIDGLHALDLGCGSGRDAYILSALVGPRGSVTGVDMTPPLLTLAKQNVTAFTERLEMSRSSLHFVHGYMEYLDQAGIEGESMDLAIANFSVSLTPDKKRTLQEVYRVLRMGGEFQFADIYASRRVPDPMRENAVLFAEGLGGAMYMDDMRALCRDIGFGEPRELSVAPVTITDESLAACVGSIQYVCVTFRCFKVPGMEMRSTEEDYGHVAKYLGTIPGQETVYFLDKTYRFEARRPTRIGGNTAAILTGSWLARHFHVDGDWREHFGPFVPTLEPRRG